MIQVDQITFPYGDFSCYEQSHSSRGHKHMQLFLSDKGFVYVVPMKDKTGATITHTVKQFAK